MTVPVPRLLDSKQLAAEMNIRVCTAESLMRKVPKVKIGRRVFVDAADIAAYVNKEKRQ